MKTQDCILILDFGSQYTQLIARRLRESAVYSLVYPFDIEEAELKKINSARVKLRGIILSGGPESVMKDNSPGIAPFLFELDVPILGICYGMQALTMHDGGTMLSAGKKEYGKTRVAIDTESEIFSAIEKKNITVWMSHGDSIKQVSDQYKCIATTENNVIAGIQHRRKAIFALQFHPELSHTEAGETILSNFLFKICKCRKTWKMKSLLDEKIQEIQAQAAGAPVLLAVSGGVDSTVLAVLLYRALGKDLRCFFVDNGLLRKNEVEEAQQLFQNMLKIPVQKTDAAEAFFCALRGVADPEEKRKTIGRIFIEVLEGEARKIAGLRFLAQGTIYSDCIESARSASGKARVIKSHHNVGGLPENLSLPLLEPLRDLFKDEVRKLGRELGIADEILQRHPFPGPGLAVRIPGVISREKIKRLRKADAIFIEELKRAKLYHSVKQAFALYISVKTVGVVGDKRCYADVIGLRAVTTLDFMSASWAKLPYDFLAHVSNRIINEVEEISRVVYDISEKPPATIEWE